MTHSACGGCSREKEQQASQTPGAHEQGGIINRFVEYDILSASDSKQLADKVNEKIAEGWQPYGDPFSHAEQLLQAVVLTADAEKRIRKTSED